MEFLLFVTKYGVLVVSIFIIISYVQNDIKLLLLKFRRQNKYIQLCLFVFASSAILYGGSKPNNSSSTTDKTSSQVNNSSKNNRNSNNNLRNKAPLPQWYIQHGYSTIDSDGDGIPDVWELWTHTKPLIYDALADYDEDGVNNITEFIYQCDPIRKDTDGDGIDDNIEIEGVITGIEELDPIVHAIFEVTEEHQEGNTICKAWQSYATTNGLTLFTDGNHNGFDDLYEERLSAPSSNNFDVSLLITTSRTALLSWDGDGIIIPPSTNRLVKLCLNCDIDVGNISLIAFPDGVSISGLWKSQMIVKFEARHGQIASQNRIKLRDGHYVDFENTKAEFIGYISSSPQRSRPNLNSTNKITLQYKSKYIFFDVDVASSCLIHGPNPSIHVYTSTNTLPLYATSGNESIIINDTDVNVAEYFSDSTINVNPLCITVYKEDNNDLKIEKRITIERTKLCRPAQTNIFGAAWTSSHNPDDSSNHLPKYEEKEIHFGPNCPIVKDINASIGFSHDKVNTRNLPLIITGNTKVDCTDHCIGIKYNSNININLFDFINAKFNIFKNNMFFEINEKRTNQIDFSVLDPPSEMRPLVFFIELFYENNLTALDQLWITIYSPNDYHNYNNWFKTNSTDLSWCNSLPRPYNSIKNNDFYDPEPDSPNLWSSPSIINSYLHHNAKYEMRTETALEQGNQACYDKYGFIITTTIAAGTADRYAPYNKLGILRANFKHRNNDVYPFIKAIQLDGNPCVPNKLFAPKNLNNPCLYQGEFLNKYLQCRPIIQPEK